MVYSHKNVDGTDTGLSVGKVVCIGKNYKSDIHEKVILGNEPPVIFMKPPSALVPLGDEVILPDYSRCYFEVELAVLIGAKITKAGTDEVIDSIEGYAVALDLTLKELLDEQKEKGRPWELAKSFDNSCPISPFIPKHEFSDIDDVIVRLTIDDKVRQEASTALMIRGVYDLISCMSRYFTLSPGDVVLTGTPPGGDVLSADSALLLELDNHYYFQTSVRK